MATIRSYTEAAKYLAESKRSKTSRKIEHNTWVEQRGDNIAIRLHQTDVVVFRPDGSTVLSTGGWKTNTTRSRLNEYLPYGYRIGQTKGQWDLWRWKVGTEGKKWENREQESHPFVDGITISAKGKISGAGTATTVKAEANRKKKILEYIDGFLKAIHACKVKQPGGGDCWFCALKTDDGKTLGDAHGDNDHIGGHVRSRYYVASLVANAVEAFPVSKNAQQYLAIKFALATEGAVLPEWLKRDEQEWRDQVNGVADKQIKVSLWKYLDQRVTVAALAA